jgi:hypothetical protein
MERVKKYENTEESKTAQKEQIKKSNQKYQAERREFRKNAFIQQQELVKLLNKNIIPDKEFLTRTLETVQAIIRETNGEKKEKTEDTIQDVTEGEEVKKEVKSRPRPKQASSIEIEL